MDGRTDGQTDDSHANGSTFTKVQSAKNEKVQKDEKQETQLALGWADHIAYIQRPPSNFWSWKKAISQNEYSAISTMVMLLH